MATQSEIMKAMETVENVHVEFVDIENGFKATITAYGDIDAAKIARAASAKALPGAGLGKVGRVLRTASGAIFSTVQTWQHEGWRQVATGVAGYSFEFAFPY